MKYYCPNCLPTDKEFEENKEMGCLLDVKDKKLTKEQEDDLECPLGFIAVFVPIRKLEEVL